MWGCVEMFELLMKFKEIRDMIDETSCEIRTNNIDKARKNTCLWLKGLPPLYATKVVDQGTIMPHGFSLEAGSWAAYDEDGKILSWNDPRTAIIRSKTFPGVAKAMAEQWAGNDVKPAYVQEELF